MAEVKLESGMSKLYELQTELNRSLEKIETLDKQYSTLKSIVSKSGKEKELPENFVQSLDEYKSNLASQMVTISNRLSYIKTLLGWYEKQDETAMFVDKVVTLAFESIGIASTTGEPEEEKEEKAE